MSPEEFADGGGQLGEERRADARATRTTSPPRSPSCGDLVDAFVIAESVPEEQRTCDRARLSTTSIAAELMANQLTGAEAATRSPPPCEQASACQPRHGAHDDRR